MPDNINVQDEEAMMADIGKTLNPADFGVTPGTPVAGAEGGMPAAPVVTEPIPGEPAAAPAAAVSPEEPVVTAPAATTTTPAPEAAPAATAAPVTVNYEGISNGLIKSVDDITRISTEYAQLKQQNEQLTQQAAVNPFANDFAKTLNQMYADGKSPEQIKAFIHLQDLGDISKLSPIDAMIQARVLRDGRDADMTRKQIERKYGITEGMNAEDKELIELDIADDAKADYAYLQEHKKELAIPAPAAAPVVNVPAISEDVIRAQVAPIKTKIVEQFNTLGTLNLNAKYEKDGTTAAKDAIQFELAIPKEFKDDLPALVENFFVESKLPVTQENMQTCLKVINHDLFDKYGVRMIQDCVNHALSVQDKAIREEYENVNGLKHPSHKKVIQTAELTDQFLESYARGD